MGGARSIRAFTAVIAAVFVIGIALPSLAKDTPPSPPPTPSPSPAPAPAPSPAPAPAPAPSPSPGAGGTKPAEEPKPENEAGGEKFWNKKVAGKINDYMKRINDAIKKCDLDAYKLAVRDWEYFVNRGFDPQFDPFYKDGDEDRDPAQVEKRHIKRYGEREKADEDDDPKSREEFLRKQDEEGKYYLKKKYDADKALLKKIKIPPFPDPCSPHASYHGGGGNGEGHASSGRGFLGDVTIGIGVGGHDHDDHYGHDDRDSDRKDKSEKKGKGDWDDHDRKKSDKDSDKGHEPD